MHGLWSFVLLIVCVVQGLRLSNQTDRVRIPLPLPKLTTRLNALQHRARGSRFERDVMYRKEGVEAILKAFKPKLVLHPEYGMLFQHQAYIHPNMQRRYQFMGVRLPDPKDLIYDYRDKTLPCLKVIWSSPDWLQNTPFYNLPGTPGHVTTHVRSQPSLLQRPLMQICSWYNRMYKTLMAATEFKMRGLRREVETYLPALLPNKIQISDINGLRYLKLTEDTDWYEFDRKNLNQGTDTELAGQKAREKCWIATTATVLGTLFSVRFKGYDMYMKYKHNKAMGEALKDLYTHQVTLTEEVNVLHNHNIYMAQRVYNELDQVNL